MVVRRRRRRMAASGSEGGQKVRHRRACRCSMQASHMDIGRLCAALRHCKPLPSWMFRMVLHITASSSAGQAPIALAKSRKRRSIMK
jgi:hypothetical protein